MKTSPILFSAPMIRAIIEGRKTQTRRVVKPQPEFFDPENTPRITKAPGLHPYIPCPYGKPGDRLWVREKFQPLFADGIENHWETDWKTGKGYSISYPATDGIQEFFNLDDELSSACKPSIHMPRWASRILLEITAVRVERLQDISEADAQAEGAYTDPACPAYDAFELLWKSINGAGSWDVNPFVWVVEFRRVV